MCVGNGVVPGVFGIYVPHCIRVRRLVRRGLVAGTNRNNAIEFVSALKYFPYGVACRTSVRATADSAMCRYSWTGFPFHENKKRRL
jgi:hypothetical protein